MIDVEQEAALEQAHCVEALRRLWWEDPDGLLALAAAESEESADLLEWVLAHEPADGGEHLCWSHLVQLLTGALGRRPLSVVRTSKAVLRGPSKPPRTRPPPLIQSAWER